MMNTLIPGQTVQPDDGKTQPVAGYQLDMVSRKDFKDSSFVEKLLRRHQNDKNAMEEIYLAYRRPLFNLAYRFTHAVSEAEDLLQEIFIKIFKSLRRIRSYKAFDAWVYRVAVNTCISFTRKRRLDEREYSDETGYSGESNTDGNPIRIQLKEAIDRLPPKQKAVFILHDVQGFSHREAAEVMKWSEGTSKSQLFKARMKLREALSAD